MHFHLEDGKHLGMRNRGFVVHFTAGRGINRSAFEVQSGNVSQ